MKTIFQNSVRKKIRAVSGFIVTGKGEARAKNYWELTDSNLEHGLMVSSLIFTVAAEAILSPAKRNISGAHTDLYGSLCVVSLGVVLGSILTGAIVKIKLASVARRPETSAKLVQKCLDDPKVHVVVMNVTHAVWGGSTIMTGAICVNVFQVLGPISFGTFLSSTACLFCACAFGHRQLGKVTSESIEKHQNTPRNSVKAKKNPSPGEGPTEPNPEEVAATRIQAVHRGNMDRKKTEEMKAAGEADEGEIQGEAEVFITATRDELDNSMLISAVFLTVAAEIVLQPANMDISGSHTDLYGSLGVLALTFCLGSVLLGTLVKALVCKVAGKTSPQNTYHFLTDPSITSFIQLSISLVWMGGIFMAGAIAVNVFQVLGNLSFYMMLGMIGGGAISCVVNDCQLSSLYQNVYSTWTTLADSEEEISSAYFEVVDEELGTTMLVSALTFTVAADGVLHPSRFNISGSHTDLYGILCVISLGSCIVSILTCTLLRGWIRKVSSDKTASLLKTNKFLQQSQVANTIDRATILMWIGTISITGAICVNTDQVLGFRSFCTVICLSVILFITLVFRVVSMRSVASKYTYSKEAAKDGSFTPLSPSARESDGKIRGLERTGTVDTRRDILDKTDNAFCHARDAELSTSMLVAAIIFTIASASVMHPDTDNIKGVHTDLYGCLGILSLISCLASIKIGTVVKNQIALVSKSASSAHSRFKAFTDDSVSCSSTTVLVCMWLGAFAILGMMSVNVYQVLGIRSFLTMIVSSTLVVAACLVGWKILKDKAAETTLLDKKDCPDTPAAFSYTEIMEASLDSNMFISAVFLTVSADGILRPDKANITGVHTDLYGSLCVLSLLTCMGSVMVASIVKSLVAGILAEDQNSIGQVYKWLSVSSVDWFIWLSTAFQWAGAITICGAITVNAQQVLGIRSCLTMVGTTAILCTWCIVTWRVLEQSLSSIHTEHRERHRASVANFDTAISGLSERDILRSQGPV